VHDRLMNIARFFAVRKRNAMRRFGEVTWWNDAAALAQLMSWTRTR
jgi:hypothetical protein